MTTDEQIGARVHELLWTRRIPQRQVYEALGVSRSSLHKKMRGEVAWYACVDA